MGSSEITSDPRRKSGKGGHCIIPSWGRGKSSITCPEYVVRRVQRDNSANGGHFISTYWTSYTQMRGPKGRSKSSPPQWRQVIERIWKASRENVREKGSFLTMKNPITSHKKAYPECSDDTMSAWSVWSTKKRNWKVPLQDTVWRTCLLIRKFLPSLSFIRARDKWAALIETKWAHLTHHSNFSFVKLASKQSVGSPKLPWHAADLPFFFPFAKWQGAELNGNIRGKGFHF